MPRRIQWSTKPHKQAGKIRERLRCLRRRMSPREEHEFAEGMDINKYIDSVRIAKQMNIVGFGLGKRQAADKTLRG
jgi:hypothetical protein